LVRTQNDKSSQKTTSPTFYTVRRGDTLQDIARKFDVGVGMMQWRNRIPDADYIVAGNTLKLKGSRRSFAQPSPPPKPAPVAVSSDTSVSESTEVTTQQTSASTSTYANGSSNSMVNPFCESGGNVQAVDPSGTYWGKYQFDYSTWVAHGGDPSLYGNASESYQDEIASHVTYDAWPNC
jgi:hypothetical protein